MGSTPRRRSSWVVLTALVVPAMLMLAATITMGILVTRSTQALSSNIRLTQDAVTGNVRTLSQVQRELLRLEGSLSVANPSAADIELHKDLASQRVQEGTLAYQGRTLGTPELLARARSLSRTWATDILPLVDQLTRKTGAAGAAGAADRQAAVDRISTLELGYNQLVSDAEITRKLQAATANQATERLVAGARWLLAGLIFTVLSFVALVAGTVMVLLRSRREQQAATTALDDATAQLQRHALVVQTTDNLVVITDELGRIEWVNDAFVRRTGFTLDEVIGRVPGSFLQSPYTDPETVALMRSRIADHEGFTCEVLNMAKDGTTYWVALEVRPTMDDKGRVTGFVAVQSDITERRATDEALRTAMQTAEETAREKAHFLASMSHEIRTPLNAVLGLTELLLDTPLNPDQRTFVDTAHRSGQLLLALVNDILDFSALDSAQVELESAPVRIRSLIDEVAVMFAPQAGREGLRLDYEIGSDVPAVLMTDGTRLRQVLINLVGNGLKFTREGGVHLVVSWDRSAPESPMLTISVADTGIGIPAARRERIFRPFTQVDASTTRTYGGTGLGLSICELIAEQMGGDLDLTSEVGRGSTFSITIPTSAGVDDKTGPNGLASDAATAMADGLTVLLVEDDAVNRMVALHMLKRLGIEADVAVDGHEAVAAAGDRRYDVIFMDVHMPGIDGLEATARIRRMSGAQPRIIALTANALDGDRERMLEAGMDDYVSKPVQLNQLAAALAACGGSQNGAAPADAGVTG